jgi:tetratricopeptide (TPR) repeat protein
MSLLLDALKKAADDKQKASQDGAAQNKTKPVSSTAEKIVAVETSAEPGAVFKEATSKETKSDSDVVSHNQAAGIVDFSLAEDPVEDVIDSGELTLVSEPVDTNDPATDDKGIKHDFSLTTEATMSNDTAAEEEVESLALESSQNPPKHLSDTDNSENLSIDRLNLEPAVSDNYKVSDEALSMLIYKTNREFKHGHRIVLFSVFMATLAILISGGAYYYMDTQANIDDIERKHRLAMLAMKVKTSSEKRPDNTEVIRNLVSDAELEEKVKFAKKAMAKKDSKQIISKVNNTSHVKPQGEKAASSLLSIQKINKVDPVAEKLDAAWLAYEAGNFAEAKQFYKEVLAIEAKNRDAMLGMGAIAITENDQTRASKYYLELLQQDPLDPIATAALTSLNSDEASLKSYEDHLLMMIQKNPDAAQLNFALGNIYVRQDNWKAAQQAYFDAWQQDNENADYIFNLAVSLDQLGKQQQALNFYKDSLHKSENKQADFSRQAVQKRINELSGL